MAAAFMYVMVMCLTQCEFVREIATIVYVCAYKSVSLSVFMCAVRPDLC